MAADLNELQFFVNVAQTGSVTAAAKRLGLPKSTISRGLSRLEERLGVRLLDRTTRRIALTDTGATYLEHCQRAISEIEQADHLVSILRDEPRGRLKIGGPMMFTRSFLVPLLPKFLELYPQLSVHILMPGCNTNPVEANLDLVIRTGPIEDSSLFMKHIGRARIGIFASHAYIERHGVPDHPSALTNHTCITLADRESGVRWRLSRGVEEVEVRLEPRVAVGDTAVHRQLAIDGVGIACFALWMVKPSEADYGLVRILPEWEPEPVDVYAIYPSRLDLAPNVRVFLQFLGDHLVFQ